jgi:hypothetical protein
MIASLHPVPSTTPGADLPRECLRIAVAQLGSRRHYAVPQILNAAGLLDTFYTDLYSGAGWPARLVHSLPQSIRPGPLRRLAGRIADLPPERVRQFPAFGVARRMRALGRNSPSGTRQTQLAANRRFGQLVAAQDLGTSNAVYVFNGAGLEILQAALRRGMHTILDQTSAPVEFEEQLAREERDCWPRWESGTTPETIWRPFADREREEWQLARQVICGSEHIRDLVTAVVPAGTTVESLSYGIDTTRFHGRIRRPTTGPLRVLFVGHLRLLKGMQYLAAATRLLTAGQVQVRMVGQSKLSALAEQELARSVELCGPVPRTMIGSQYDWADVFVLPTLSEGSAVVCYEALAAGLPVVTTPHAGSVVRDGVEGFIVPIRSSESLAERLAYLAENRQALEEMSQRALARSREFMIRDYARRLVLAITRESVVS